MAFTVLVVATLAVTLPTDPTTEPPTFPVTEPTEPVRLPLIPLVAIISENVIVGCVDARVTGPTDRPETAASVVSLSVIVAPGFAILAQSMPIEPACPVLVVPRIKFKSING